MLGFLCFGRFGNTKRQDNIKITLGSQDLALLDPERDLSIKAKKCMSLKFKFKVLG